MKWKYILKVKIKGSYTVENAVIVPVFVLIVLLLITLGFFVHDVGVVKEVLWKSAVNLDAAYGFATEDEKVSQLKEKYIQEIQNDTFFIKESKISDTLHASKIEVTCEYRINMVFFGNIWQKQKAVYERSNPAINLRRMRNINK